VKGEDQANLRDDHGKFVSNHAGMCVHAGHALLSGGSDQRPQGRCVMQLGTSESSGKFIKVQG
jgi:hypothetical protein